MARHLRSSSATETDALYRPLPQSEAVSEATSSPLELEGDEELVAEEFVAQERLASHDRRIGWIHFILGSAILLPWNGTSNLSSRLMIISQPFQPKHHSSNHGNAVLLVAGGRLAS